MAVDEKILARLENLLRLASPESGTTQHEREVAALEMVRLMVKHNVAFGDAPERQTASRGQTQARGQPQPRGAPSPHAWVLTKTTQYSSCVHCFKVISREDIVWCRILADRTVQWRHDYGDCRPR